MKSIGRQYSRYLVAGIIFTLFGPSLFIILSSIIGVIYASISTEIIVHIIRFNVFKYIVFRRPESSVYTYLASITPISLMNITLAISLRNLYSPTDIAIIVVILSATLGYIWTKFCFKRISKISFKLF